MERYVLLVVTLLCIHVTFSYAEETTERKITFQHLKSQPKNRVCPDGTLCPDYMRCCPIPFLTSWHCCHRKGPSQKVETEFKRNGFIVTSGNVFSPDEKHQCPDGTSTCELPSGTDGCCPIQTPRKIIKIMETVLANPYSLEDADPETEDRRP